MKKEKKKFNKILKKYGYNKKTFNTLADLLAKAVSSAFKEVLDKQEDKTSKFCSICSKNKFIGKCPHKSPKELAKEKPKNVKHKTSSPKIVVKKETIESAKTKLIKNKQKLQKNKLEIKKESPKPKNKLNLKFSEKGLKKFAEMEDGHDFTVANPNILKDMKNLKKKSSKKKKLVKKSKK